MLELSPASEAANPSGEDEEGMAVRELSGSSADLVDAASGEGGDDNKGLL